MLDNIDHIIACYGIDAQTGRLASITMSCVVVPVLPTPLVTEALMVSSLPSACKTFAGTLTLQLNLATVAVLIATNGDNYRIPAAAVPVTCPLMVCATAISAALIMSSPATVLITQ